MSKQGYATCHRSSPKDGHRLTNMREAVTAAQSTAGMASAAGSTPLRAQLMLSRACHDLTLHCSSVMLSCVVEEMQLSLVPGPGTS